jgi:hypothetical protein
MKPILSLDVEKTMFEKLSEIGFLHISERHDAGFIKDCSYLVFNPCDNDVDYEKIPHLIFNLQFSYLEKEMFEKLVEIGAVIRSHTNSFIVDGVSKYWLSGQLFGKFGVSTDSFITEN